MRNENIKNEQGRTLVEMLGVLAVMGLLSVTGIELYETAMNKNFSNDIMQSAYKRAATRAEKSKSGKTKKNFVANLYEDMNKTAYSFGITVPQLACDHEVIPVGLINKDDRPITPKLCQNVVSAVESEDIFLTVFDAECQEITTSTASSLCAGASMLQIALSPAVEPTPALEEPAVEPTSEPEEPAPEPTPGAEDPTPEPEEPAVEPTLVPEDSTPELEEPAPEPESSVCEGISVKADSATSMNFNPACPEDYYIDIQEGETEGCCKPCPDGKVTPGSGTNFVGIDQCINPGHAHKECPKSVTGSSHASNDFCDAGHFEYHGGQKYCCRGYRHDSNNWAGYSGVQCCPVGTSVNRWGQCIPCCAGQYYNMGYADIQSQEMYAVNPLDRQNIRAACGQRCRTNDDCPSNRFCYMDAHATQADTTVDPIVGICVTAEDMGGIVSTPISLNGGALDYWMGPRNLMDWWSARNFCLRYGHVDLPTRQMICGADVEQGGVCDSPLRLALEEKLGSQQKESHFWLEATENGKAYYVDPKRLEYKVKIPPEITARARTAGVVCGPLQSPPSF